MNNKPGVWWVNQAKQNRKIVYWSHYVEMNVPEKITVYMNTHQITDYKTVYL